jgi:hypothetical protein
LDKNRIKDDSTFFGKPDIMKEQTPAGSNNARDESSQQKHHWSVTSAWRYALDTITALEKKQRLAKRRRPSAKGR